MTAGQSVWTGCPIIVLTSELTSLASDERKMPDSRSVARTYAECYITIQLSKKRWIFEIRAYRIDRTE